MWEACSRWSDRGSAGSLVVDRSCPLPGSLHRWAYRKPSVLSVRCNKSACAESAPVLSLCRRPAGSDDGGSSAQSGKPPGEPVAPVSMFGLGKPLIWSPGGSPTLTTVSAYTPVKRPERGVVIRRGRAICRDRASPLNFGSHSRVCVTLCAVTFVRQFVATSVAFAQLSDVERRPNGAAPDIFSKRCCSGVSNSPALLF